MATSINPADTGAIMLTGTALQNHVLIWFDEKNNESDYHFRNSVLQLREIINQVYSFRDVDACIDFLTDIDQQQIFFLASQILAQQLMPYIHSMVHLLSVYVISNNQEQSQSWIKAWPKIKGVYTDITLICADLQQSVKQCNNDAIPISFVSVNDNIKDINLDQLEPSFMYTQLFKNTLLDMHHDYRSRQELVSYCRQNLPQTSSIEKVISEFEHEYNADKAV